MVPFRLKPPQFRQRYRQSLDKLADGAIAALRAHLARPVEAGVETAEVQLFLNADDAQPLSLWIYYQGPHNKVDAADDRLFAGRSLALALGLAAQEPFDERYAQDEDFGGLHIMADSAKAWFAECWWKAGGWDYGVPATLSVHDGWGDGAVVRLTAAQPAAARKAGR